MPLAEDDVKASDAMGMSLTTEAAQPDRKPYRVLTSLFKNGQEYPEGSTIELDDKTAANFIAAGNVEEA